MKKNPLKLKPAVKDYLWGGSRLRDDFHYEVEISPFAEAWVCSTHPDGSSLVISNDRKENQYETLANVIKKHPEYLGSHARSIANGEMPILIKLIDANKDLSIQVHPDDEYASRMENSLGKTEMWYVLDAQEDAKLVYGFNRDVNKTEIKAKIDKGGIINVLNYVSIKKDDIFLIEPGTVHAICAGTLIAEIQENSNITYRLYDYDRIDKNGMKRQLHLDKALEVANFKSSKTPRRPMRVLKYHKGYAKELLSRCKYFQVERMLINTKIIDGFIHYKTEINSFHVFLCLEGSISVFNKDYNTIMEKGDCVFIPADCDQLLLDGCAQLLDVSC